MKKTIKEIFKATNSKIIDLQNVVLNAIFGGGVLEGSIYVMYGEAVAGKTSTATSVAGQLVRLGYRVWYIDVFGRIKAGFQSSILEGVKYIPLCKHKDIKNVLTSFKNDNCPDFVFIDRLSLGIRKNEFEDDERKKIIQSFLTSYKL